MNRIVRYGMLLAALAFVAPLATAQSAGAKSKSKAGTESSFKVGYMDVGPTVGLGGTGGGIGIGGRFERGFKALPDLNNGVLGIEASVDTWSYSQSYLTASASLRYISVGVTANYHFQIDGSPKVDPFVGLGLGNSSVSSKAKVGGIDYDFGANASSGIYFIGRAGIRYFYKPRLALYADAGAGARYLNAGVMFGLGGGK